MSGLSEIGGTEQQLKYISDLLSQQSICKFILILGKIQGEKNNPIYTDLKKNGLITLSVLNTTIALWIIHLLKPSVVFCFNAGALNLAQYLANLHIKIIYYETGLPEKNDVWYQPLKTNIQHVNQVISVSHQGVQQLRNQFDYTGPAKAIASLIDVPKIVSNKHLSLSKTFTLVYFGRYVVLKKGIENLLYAFSTIHKNYPHAKLLLIGDKEHLKFKKLCDQLHITDHVQFHEKKQGDELYTLISQADLVCLPSLTEGLPCSIIEAMSLGIPAVASNIGGIPELIEDGVNGLLIPPNNIIALSKAISTFADNPSLIQSMGQNAKIKFKREHNQTSLKQKYIHTILEIMDAD
jgi:glycosyltransferase involved in cell wall biosynthesis